MHLIQTSFSSNDTISVTILLHENLKETGEELLEEIQKFSDPELVDFNDHQLRILVARKDLDVHPAFKDQVMDIRVKVLQRIERNVPDPLNVSGIVKRQFALIYLSKD
jgi:hypothetical protein